MPKKVRVSWQQLGEALDIQFRHPGEDAIRARVAAEAKAMADAMEAEHKMTLTDEERREVHEAATEFVKQHWSLPTVLCAHLDLDDLVSAINSWTRKGIRSKGSTRSQAAGYGITDWTVDETGVQFSVAPSFLCAYVDSRSCIDKADDDGLLLKDVEPHHVLATLKRILDCESRGQIVIDVTKWDEQREPPTYEALCKCIEDLRKVKREKAAAAAQQEPSHAEPQDQRKPADRRLPAARPLRAGKPSRPGRDGPGQHEPPARSDEGLGEPGDSPR